MARRHSLSGVERQVYLACDSAQTLGSLKRALELPREIMSQALERMERDRLVLRQGDRYLALATRGSLPALPGARDFPGGVVLAAPRQAPRPWLTVGLAPVRSHS